MQQPDEHDWPTDALLAAHSRGKRPALETLFGRYLPIAIRMARSQFGPEWDRDFSAEDIAQESMLRAIQDLDQYRGEGRFRAWIFRVLQRTVHDAIRQATAQKRDRDKVRSIDDEAHAATHTTPSQCAHLQELEARVLDAVDRMGDRERQIYTMLEVCGMTYDEIADELAITPGNARVIASRVRNRIRARIVSDAARRREQAGP